MNKIAEDITVFALHYFAKQRPFEVLNGRIVKKPVFPNKLIIRKKAPGTSAWDKDTVSETYSSQLKLVQSVEPKPLFIEGDDYRAGIYHGDVYEVPDKKYYLFRIVREPIKYLILPNPITQMTGYIKLVIESPGGRVNNIQVKRGDTWQEDMKLAEDKIESLMATMPTLHDKATPELETYIRAYYAMKKIQSVGGDDRKHPRYFVLPLKK